MTVAPAHRPADRQDEATLYRSAKRKIEPGAILEPMWDRHLPALTIDNSHYWQGGRDGNLTLRRCQDCGYYLHPPGPRCPDCGSGHVEAESLSGQGRLYTYTVNEHQWETDMPVRYVIGNVELREQPGLRLTTNIVGCEPSEVHIGMELAACFERHGDIYLPLFVPAAHD